jgi:hypothetical protein
VLQNPNLTPQTIFGSLIRGSIMLKALRYNPEVTDSSLD